MFRAPSLHVAPPRRRMRDDPRRAMYIVAVVAVCGATLIGQVFWTAQNKHKFAPFAIERIRCDHCRGLGVLSKRGETGGTQLQMCPACYGVGAHQIRRIDDDDVLCPACVGFGRVEEADGSWRWCRRCDGRGLVRREGARAAGLSGARPALRPAPAPDPEEPDAPAASSPQNP